ncbi:hypothetical protein Bbelb_192800 [Branchiostoma belcheri]|nr:hypothetical protein Bbelb_192800 [Branchiostoma belcheri]
MRMWQSLNSGEDGVEDEDNSVSFIRAEPLLAMVSVMTVEPLLGQQHVSGIFTASLVTMAPGTVPMSTRVANVFREEGLNEPIDDWDTFTIHAICIFISPFGLSVFVTMIKRHRYQIGEERTALNCQMIREHNRQLHLAPSWTATQAVIPEVLGQTEGERAAHTKDEAEAETPWNWGKLYELDDMYNGPVKEGCDLSNIFGQRGVGTGCGVGRQRSCGPAVDPACWCVHMHPLRRHHGLPEMMGNSSGWSFYRTTDNQDFPRRIYQYDDLPMRIYCPHGVCYAFEAIRSCESPQYPFKILHGIVVYDNSCQGLASFRQIDEFIVYFKKATYWQLKFNSTTKKYETYEENMLRSLAAKLRELPGSEVAEGDLYPQMSDQDPRFQRVRQQRTSHLLSLLLYTTDTWTTKTCYPARPWADEAAKGGGLAATQAISSVFGVRVLMRPPGRLSAIAAANAIAALAARERLCKRGRPENIG